MPNFDFIEIEKDHIKSVNTDTDRLDIIYSKVKFTSPDFIWETVLPVLTVPRNDPKMGFLIGGTTFSTLGIYQMAKGVVPSITKGIPTATLVTNGNRVLKVKKDKNTILLNTKIKQKEKNIPIGVFLKAVMEKPYSEIIKNVAVKPPEFRNAFPSDAFSSIGKLSKAKDYACVSGDIPRIEDCIDRAYSFITGKTSDVLPHWKKHRLQSFVKGISKDIANYETNMSVASRAIGHKLSKAIELKLFDSNGEVYTLKFPKGHFISSDDAKELSRVYLDIIHVQGFKLAILQEFAPPLFRIKGYKLLKDITVGDEVFEADTVIDDKILMAINSTDLEYLQVMTPDGVKDVFRSKKFCGEDFLTLTNVICNLDKLSRSNTSTFDIANRAILSYDEQVENALTEVYNDIIDSISTAKSVDDIMKNLPSLPSNSLVQLLRDPRRKEVGQSSLTNAMSVSIASQRSSALLPSATREMMYVQSGQYGRIDALHSPDSDKVGSVQQQTFMSKLDSNGSILTPYEVVRDGVPTGEIQYITASKEANKYIVAWNDDLLEPTVLARHNGDVTSVHRERVDYRDASPFLDMSISRMTNPFAEFSQPKRAIMAAKMNGQAIPTLRSERPVVGTGAESVLDSLLYRVSDILKQNNVDVIEGATLKLLSSKFNRNVMECQFSYGEYILPFSVPYIMNDKHSLFFYRLNREVEVAGEYKYDDVVFISNSCDTRKYDFITYINQGTLKLFDDYTKPSLAIGVNLKIAIKTSGSSTIDDSVVINRRLIGELKLSTIRVDKYEYELKEFEKLSYKSPKNTYVSDNDTVISITNTKTNKSKDLFSKGFGYVTVSTYSEVENKITVIVSSVHHPIVGDKVAGRYGNKSIIGKIQDEELMPFDPETGETIDMIVSPLSMPSRMNYGLLIEAMFGMVALMQGKKCIVTPFYPNIKELGKKAYDELGLKPKRLFLPEFGRYTELPVFIGYSYYLKLEQMSDLKYNAVGEPIAVDAIFNQPVKSVNQGKGQAIGEMESHTLIASGMRKFLDSISLYSDAGDRLTNQYLRVLKANPKKKLDDTWNDSIVGLQMHSVENVSALSTEVALRSFGIRIVKRADNYVFLPFDANSANGIQTTASRIINDTEKAAIDEWSYAKLNAPVVNPFWVKKFPLKSILGVKSISRIVDGRDFVNTDDISEVVDKSSIEDLSGSYLTGMPALIYLLEHTSIERALDNLIELGSEDDCGVYISNSDDSTDSHMDGTDIEIIEEEDDELSSDTEIIDEVTDESLGEEISKFVEVPISYKALADFLKNLKEANMTLADLVWYYFPVMPKRFRQSMTVKGVKRQAGFTKLIRGILEAPTSDECYKQFLYYLGYAQRDDTTSILSFFFNRGSKDSHGALRDNVLSKKVGYSGRFVIAPVEDITMSPYYFGLPWVVLCKELATHLSIRCVSTAKDISMKFVEAGLQKYSSTVEIMSDIEWKEIVASLYEFNFELINGRFHANSIDDAHAIYNKLRDIIKYMIEGDTKDGLIGINGEYYDPLDLPDDTLFNGYVIFAGRQPTLHRKGIRSFFIKVVDGYCGRIHPSVCGSYNADFDGDTMYDIMLFGELKIEALKHNSILQDLISEKDGSYTLDLHQDIALGLMYATSFKNGVQKYENTKDNYYFMSSVKELELRLHHDDDISYQDTVVLKSNGRLYCSTAGRILVNAKIPDGLTHNKSTDPHGIIKLHFGDSSDFFSLKYDSVLTDGSARPDGAYDSNWVMSSSILMDVYNNDGARASVDLLQRLYEVGLTASELSGITMSIDDLSSKVDIEQYMVEPREKVQKYNDLYLLGLMDEDTRKSSAAKAWDYAKESAKNAIIKSLDLNSGVAYMMYSGARGKPDQVMQSVGFVGTIAKSETEEIEYPILHGYGSGLTSLEMSQTTPAARLAVVSTEAGTKDTGYSTRKSVYMTSGIVIDSIDCGIKQSIVKVDYEPESITLNGVPTDFNSVKHSIVTSGKYKMCTLDYAIAEEIKETGSFSIECDCGTIKYERKISNRWKQLINGMCSYSMPYLDGMSITDKSIDWIEKNQLSDIVAFPKELVEEDKYLDLESFIDVLYDSYELTDADGNSISESFLFNRKISNTSKDFEYYEGILKDGTLNPQALRYIAFRKIRSISFEDGGVILFKYKVTPLFKDLVIGRVGYGLKYLDDNGCITKKTVQFIEDNQLEKICVRTSLTCLSKCVCSKCFGSPFKKVGDNIGIPASQSMCESLSQSTMNVAHGGMRKTGLNSGIEFYYKMLDGSLTTAETKKFLEILAPCKARISTTESTDSFYLETIGGQKIEIFGETSLPNGAVVDEGDTIVNGLTDLEKMNSCDVFMSAYKIRMMLIKEYHSVFSSLKVAARNYEIMARAQTMVCYLTQEVDLPLKQHVSVESKAKTGKYLMRVSTQGETVIQNTGIATPVFEYVAARLTNILCEANGVKCNSWLGNLMTGTTVGDSSPELLFETPKTKQSNVAKERMSMESNKVDSIELNSGMQTILGILSSGGSIEQIGSLIQLPSIAEEEDKTVMPALPTSLFDEQIEEPTEQSTQENRQAEDLQKLTFGGE